MASQREKLNNAIKAADFEPTEAGSPRHKLLTALAKDEEHRAERPQPKMPEITFPYRRLPGESRWARERIKPKRIE